MDLFQIKKEKISINFYLDGEEIKIESKRNEYMKEIIKQYLIKIKKNHENCFFLYKGNMVKEELKIEEINNKDNVLKILVYEIEDHDICEENLKDSK